MIREYPPLLHGTPEDQVAQLRAYLVRLVGYIEEELQERGEKNVQSTN